MRRMGLFNFFGENEHNVFDYKPIYYDKEKEERKRLFGAVDGSMEQQKEQDGYTPGTYIKGAMRGGRYQATRGHMQKTQALIGIVSLLLIVAVIYFIIRFYSLL
ncbi:MAG: hypothetical protein J5871_00235 [Bacteroidales bacterium]|nr:hypothetical protein [Bacteroidales bacterium]